MGTNLLTKQRMMMGETPDKGLLANRTDLTADYVKSVVRAGKGAMPAQTRVDVTNAELEAVSRYLGRRADADGSARIARGRVLAGAAAAIPGTVQAAEAHFVHDSRLAGVRQPSVAGRESTSRAFHRGKRMRRWPVRPASKASRGGATGRCCGSARSAGPAAVCGDASPCAAFRARWPDALDHGDALKDISRVKLDCTAAFRLAGDLRLSHRRNPASAGRTA
jgi:hypothetical protein